MNLPLNYIFSSGSFKIFSTTKQFTLYSFSIPKNTPVALDTRTNDLYFCTKFPYNYKGSRHNIMLNVLCFELDSQIAYYDIFRHNIIANLFIDACFNHPEMPRIEKLIPSEPKVNYAALMKSANVRKKHSTGRRLATNPENDVYDLRYKQGNEYAYYHSIGMDTPYFG